jgi:hypothetical protein
VYGKGFNDLEIDSVRTTWRDGRWQVSILVNQRLRGTYIPQESVRTELGYWTALEDACFSGTLGWQSRQAFV